MTPLEGVLYQPIPFAEFSDLPCERDSSVQRLGKLKKVVDYKGAVVLDLGCANGWFLFSLAKDDAGIASGLGVDHFADNVHLASELARIYALNHRLTFRQAGISPELISDLLSERRWTVCHLMAVHHHLLRQIGLEATKDIFRRLWGSGAVLVLEQGSLTQEEYTRWTGRDEPFDSGSFSRMISMIEACGISVQSCRPIGHAHYLSGLRDDRLGSRRVLIACCKEWEGTGAVEIQRKQHRNGINMELVRVRESNDESTFWKNNVVGGSLARREVAALSRLSGELGFVKLKDPGAADEEAADGLIRLRGQKLRRIRPEDVRNQGERIRGQLMDRLLALATHGIVHGELASEHCLLNEEGGLTILDFETARFRDESAGSWIGEVYESNLALGLGMYPREIHLGPDWKRADCIAVDALLGSWGLEALSPREITLYLETLESAGAGP
jgi:hypothetical protein